MRVHRIGQTRPVRVVRFVAVELARGFVHNPMVQPVPDSVPLLARPLKRALPAGALVAVGALIRSHGRICGLAADPAQAARLARLTAKLVAYEATAFNPHRGPTDPAACKAVADEYGGFWGPWQDDAAFAALVAAPAPVCDDCI